MKIEKGIIKTLNSNKFKLQNQKNILRNKMVDLLSDKQNKQIIATIKKKVKIFKNKLQKTKQNFRETKYRITKKLAKRIGDIHKKNENQKSCKMKKREKSIKGKSLQKSKRIY